MAFHVVIPARYGSTRLPGKPLLDIGGKPMIQRVVDQACASGADEVLVATDDARIAGVVRDPRRPSAAIGLMTEAGLPSGTDRVAAVAAERGWREQTIVVNVQGDEPFLPPGLIDQVAALAAARADAGVATLAVSIESLEEFLDPNVVKVVSARDGTALYFSRAPIPWPREGAAGGFASQSEFRGAMRHIGLYAYRVSALRRLSSLPPSALEGCEKLEQLRALEHGVRIVVAACAERPGPGVDTESDLQLARQRAARRS